MKRLLLLLIPVLLLANGGPDGGTPVVGAGNIAFAQKRKIDIVSEVLQITLNEDNSNVTVEYNFFNSGASEDVTILFPVDYDENSDVAYSSPEEFVAEAIQSFNVVTPRYNGNIPTQIREVESGVRSIEYGDYASPIGRVWYEFTVPIPSGDTTLVSINYIVQNNYIDWSTSKSILPSFGSQSFNYTFTPAQYWGEGVIEDFTVSIDVNEIENQLSGFNMDIPFEMELNEGVYSYSASNVRPRDMGDLSIMMDFSQMKTSEYIARRSVDLSHATSASSTLEGNYGVGNLYDGELTTAWVEGVSGYGNGERITIDMTDYPRLLGVYIANGYHKSSRILDANSSILEATFIVEYYPSYAPDSLVVQEYTITPNRPEWNSNGYPELVTLFDGGDGFYGHRVERVHLELNEGYSAHYEDLCISELFICAQ